MTNPTPPVFLHPHEQAALGLAPLTPEAVAQMVADREAGTPGPWRFDGPVWNQIVWTDIDNRLCFMAHSNGLNDDRDIANARRIARLPDLEAAYLTLSAENATLRSERDALAYLVCGGEDFPGLLDATSVEELERIHKSNIRMYENAEFALRASEAAALDALAEIGVAVAAIEGADRLDKEIIQNIGARIAALTPTADKE